jgi:hypothetical protein
MYLSFYVIVILKFGAPTCHFVRKYMKMAQLSPKLVEESSWEFSNSAFRVNWLE